MKFKQEEYKTITIVQAAGIVSVVIGHFYYQPFDVLHPYTYHMPLFFFLGGLLMSEGSLLNSIQKTITKHGSYLVKSYIITGIIASLLVYLYGVEQRKPFSDGVLSTIEFTIKNNFGNNPLFVVAWFLFAYIIASIICKTIVSSAENIKRKKLLIAIVSTAFFFIGIKYLPSIYTNRSMYLVNLSAQVATACGFILTGYLMKGYIFKIIRFDVMATLLFLMIIIKNAGMQKGVNIAWSVYQDGFILSVVTTLSGIYIVFTLCHSASKIDGFNKIISYVGRNTKSIMTYHILAFYLVDIFFFKSGMYDITQTATYSHYKSVGSWPIYILAGVFIPVAMSYLYEKIKHTFIKIFHLSSNSPNNTLPH